MTRNLIRFIVAALGSLLVAAPAAAGMVSTEEIERSLEAQIERSELKAQLARPDVAKELEAQGVDATEARARVDAMTDAEVTELAGKVATLPAGGLTNAEALLILIIVLILLL